MNSTNRLLQDVLSVYNMHNMVDFPTRITNTTATCLDHVYTNMPTDCVRASPVLTNLSDHLAVRTEMLCTQIETDVNSYYVARDYSESNRANFVSSIDSVDWFDVCKRSSTADALVTSVTNIIANKIDICFPFKKKHTKKPDSSWVTPDVKNIKYLLFDIMKLQQLFPDDIYLTNFIEKLNFKYESLLNIKKANYYNHLILSSKSASQGMWSVVNKERGKANTPRIKFAEVVVDTDGKKFSSPEDAVDSMNERFLNAARACGAPRADVASVLRALSSCTPADRSLRLQPFTADEVYKAVTTRIPPKHSKDVYGISMELMRYAIIPLAPILATLFNTCLREGSYPRPLKVSKVAPIFKGKGKRNNIDGYRPVSIIPALAKIFENGLSCRLTEFLHSTNALSDRQYAYRAGRSTISMTREVVRRLMDAREKKLQVAMICCDLSKAFDVADHEVLALKLKHYGIANTAYALFTDLLQERSQIVDAGDGKTRSKALTSKMGVAQGSSVSNILFSLLLNDLPSAVTTADILMYADDVAAIVTARTVDGLERQLNIVASDLAEWFNMNGLALNLGKTHFMHLNLSGRRLRSLAVTVGGIQINQVQSLTFLGFEIDSRLTWEDHIQKMCGKLGSACFALKRVSRVVPADVARTCYFGTVHSLLQYGAELWGRAADWERVFRMQKRAVRALVQVSQRTSARPYFKQLGVLTLPATVIFQVAVYVRTNIELFKKNCNRHNFNTRNANKLAAVQRTFSKSDKLTHVMGPAVYNKLPKNIIDAPSLTCFKTKLKNWLIEHTFYSFKEFLECKG